MGSQRVGHDLKTEQQQSPGRLIQGNMNVHLDEQIIMNETTFG